MMRFVDPVTGRQQVRSTGTRIRREAERAAAKWEADLRQGKYHAPSGISWSVFRERCESEKGTSLAANSLSPTVTAFNQLERVVQPLKLATVSSSLLSQFQARLRKEEMKDTTIATHLRHLRAKLSWVVSVGQLAKVPDIHLPRRAKGRNLMRGRPITLREFDSMLSMVPEVRLRDAEAWKYHLNGLSLSGLRLENRCRFHGTPMPYSQSIFPDDIPDFESMPKPKKDGKTGSYR